MTTEIFKINSIGLDTSTIKEVPGEITCSEYDFIYTKISANNDYYLSDFIYNSDTYSSIIVGVDFLDNLEDTLREHLSLVSFDNQVSLLLIDSSLVTSEMDVSELLNITESNLVDEIGIMNPTGPDQIKLLSELFGGTPIFEIGLDICPLNFNAELIEYCTENNIKITGFNPFGGHISGPAMIEAFTCPYLLGFISNYCETVIVSGKDLILAQQARLYLDSLKNQETSPKFKLRKSVSKLVKPLKPLVKTSLRTFGDALVLPYNSPELLYDYSEVVFNFLDKKGLPTGADYFVIPDPETTTRTETENQVLDLIENLSFPSDGDVSSHFAVLRYKVLRYIKSLYPDNEGWSMSGCIRISDRALGIGLIKKIKTTEKHWFKKDTTTELITDTKSFILALPELGNPIFFETQHPNSEK